MLALILMVGIPPIFAVGALSYLGGDIKNEFQGSGVLSRIESMLPPIGVSLIVFFLLLNALGSIIVTFYYLEALSTTFSPQLPAPQL
ncbi:MAG: hypothetical protein QXO71_08450 [Candidatus Jordarchaeaceae archaeon]